MSAAFSVMSSKSWSRSANMIAVIDCDRSEEHTSELQSRLHLVCRLLLEKKRCEWLRQHLSFTQQFHSSPGGGLLGHRRHQRPSRSSSSSPARCGCGRLSTWYRTTSASFA